MWKAEWAGVDWKFLSGGLRTTAEAPPAMQCQSVTVTQNLHDQVDGNDDDDGDNDAVVEDDDILWLWWQWSYEDDDNNANIEKDDDYGDNDVDVNDCELAKHAMAVSVTMTQNLHQKAIGGYAQSTVCCRVNLLKNNDYNFLHFSLE